MSQIIIKLRRGLDLYMVWSSVVDNVIAVATRAELQDDWHARDRMPVIDDLMATRLARADRFGTSAVPWKWRGRTHREGSWTDAGFVVNNGPEGWLPRRHFLPYALACRDGKPAKAARLVQPFDDLLPEIARRRRARELYRRRRG